MNNNKKIVKKLGSRFNIINKTGEPINTDNLSIKTLWQIMNYINFMYNNNIYFPNLDSSDIYINDGNIYITNLEKAVIIDSRFTKIFRKKYIKKLKCSSLITFIKWVRSITNDKYLQLWLDNIADMHYNYIKKMNDVLDFIFYI